MKKMDKKEINSVAGGVNLDGLRVITEKLQVKYFTDKPIVNEGKVAATRGRAEEEFGSNNYVRIRGNDMVYFEHKDDAEELYKRIAEID